ncbi:MAG: hypothetical protein FJX77_03635 [Armatimonadetes bacterium]|nr:hypothetical protein [Armatimonadota bacterium]
MRRLVSGLAAMAAALCLAGSALAADVKITGLHNCCPGCNNALTKVLNDAGIANPTINKGEVSFSAEDPNPALTALANAGFGGTVTGGRYPRQQGLGDLKGTKFKVEGIHNCCGACAKNISEILKPLGTVELKARETSFTITTQNEIPGRMLLMTLRQAGYNGKISAAQ